MASQPNVSIVIPVVHTYDDLRLCLDSLERLTYPRDRFRVTVIDCGLLDDLAGWMAQRTEAWTYALDCLTLPQKPPSRFDWVHELRLNEARNLGVRAGAADVYVITEDDCYFHPDWIEKMLPYLADDVGLLCGPDVLPGDFGTFEVALDALLNSPVGSPGGRRMNDPGDASYAPIKDYQVIPAAAMAVLMPFPEDVVFGTEAKTAACVRSAGLKIVYMPDNPVWHRRTTTPLNFIRRNRLIAGEKTAHMLAGGRFFGSAHSMVLLAFIGAMVLATLSLYVAALRLPVLLGIAVYAAAAVTLSARIAVKRRSARVGLLHLALVPVHHASVLSGILNGVFLRERALLRKD